MKSGKRDDYASSEFASIVSDADRYAEELLWIRSKRGRIIPLKLNPVQRKLRAAKRKARAKGRRRFIVLKARRQGITTSEQAESFHQTATQDHQQCVTLSHDHSSTEKIFRIANLFYDKLHETFRPTRLTQHNKRNLDFPKLNSLFYVGTAGARGFARGDTLNKAHWSEVAFSPGSIEEQRTLLAGITEACSEGETVLESTTNGVGGLFHEIWKDATSPGSEWTPIFFAWWEDPTYRIRLKPEQAISVAKSLTKEEQLLVETHGLAPEQIAWRRKKKAQLKELFEQEYPEDPETCFLISGECFFNRVTIAILIKRVMQPIETRDNDAIRIWERPIAERRYAAGSDVAEGLPKGDFCQTSIVDATTMKQVAVLRGKWKPEEFARKTADLCIEYNTAHLAVERNNHGHSMLNTLVNGENPYPNLYYHLDYDATTGAHTPTLGFPTTQKTRPIMLNDLRDAVEKGQMEVNDAVFLGECRTFTPDRNGVYRAKGGCKDDAVLSWGIALQARKKALEGIVIVPSNMASLQTSARPRIFPQGPGRIF